MRNTPRPQPIYRVRALDSLHHFYGDEHPDMRGCPFQVYVGDSPKEVSASLAEYFAGFPGLKIEVTNPTVEITEE